jgi:hypothetical protein
MINHKTLCKFAIPVGVSLLCWLTMRTVVSSGGESLAMYGFPLPWYAPSAASSMAYDMAAGPFVIDLLVYVTAAQAIISFGTAGSTVPLKVGRLAAILLWLLAVGSIACTALATGFDPHVAGWTLDGYFGTGATRTHALHFGLGRGA